MFGRLLFLFTVVPILELALLIEVGKRIGSLPTIAIVLATGFFGAFLAKQQGFSVIRRIQIEAREGQMPGDPLLDGLFVLVGGVMLVTPGLVTDVLGLSFLLPVTRRLFKRWIKRKLQLWLETGEIHIFRLR